MGTIARLVVGIVIEVAWLYGFDALGWITIHSQGGQWDYLLTLILIALVSNLLGFMLFLAIPVIIQLSCGIGCVFIPFLILFFGGICLWGVSVFTPWMSINVDPWWQGLVMSIAYGLIGLPPSTKTTTTYRYTSGRW